MRPADRGSRLLAVLAPLLVLALMALVAPASPAQAAAQHRRSTAISGWSKAPVSIDAGSVHVTHVRVTGGRRTVQLQRRVGSAWKNVDVARSNRAGRATLTWTTPRTTSTVALRVRVPRAGRWAANVSRARLVRVVSSRPAPPDPTPVPDEPTPSTPSVPEAPVVLDPLDQEVLDLVNEARASGVTCGDEYRAPVPPVKANAQLNQAAGDYAQTMATENFFSHGGLDGSNPGDRIRAAGYSPNGWGENIAAGHTEPAKLVAAWLRSPGHCLNIMSASVTETGVGHGYDADSYYGTYWVQVFSAR